MKVLADFELIVDKSIIGSFEVLTMMMMGIQVF
jgi:hypothetical protein